jgi:nucleoside-diphosphate-sugar epimerase
LYGACKHAAHIVATAAAGELGLSLAWARLFFLYGPGEQPGRLVSDVAKGLLAGEEVPTTGGAQRRDFMHVRDAAGALVALVVSNVNGPVNVASGESVAVADVLRLIGEAANATERVRFGARPERAGEPSELVADVRRLREEVGWPSGVSLAEGIAEAVDWWRRCVPEGEGAPESARTGASVPSGAGTHPPR